MTLLSELLAQKQQDAPAKPAPAVAPNTRALGVVLIVFGLLCWLPAARTTVDGWVIILNTMLDIFRIPLVLPRVTGWLLLGLAIGIGLLYSLVETQHTPVRVKGGRFVIAPLMFWVGWLFLSSTDIGSTFLGILDAPPNAWPIHRQIASNLNLTALLAMIGTFAPDWIILLGWRALGIRLFK